MEKSLINDLTEKYKLSQKEHNTILELLKKDLFEDRVGEKEPSIMFVVGQPGCGKTTFIRSTNLPKYIIINSDDYRRFSKYSNEILDKYTTDYAKLSNIEAHNKCYDLLPDFILGCLSLGVKVNYVISNGNQFKVIPVGDDCLSLLQKIREESNEYALLTYGSRIDTIKRNMTNRNASQEQFDELSKIEGIYSELSRCDNKGKKSKKL